MMLVLQLDCPFAWHALSATVGFEIWPIPITHPGEKETAGGEIPRISAISDATFFQVFSEFEQKLVDSSL